MQDEQDLQQLAHEIKKIYIDHNDLLMISIEFSKVYFQKRELEEEYFDKFWSSKALLSLMSQATQEAVSLAVSSFTLKEDINFQELINLVINWQHQEFYINELAQDDVEKNTLLNFVLALRREVFSRVCAQNRTFIEVSEIPFDVLQERKDFFMEINDND